MTVFIGCRCGLLLQLSRLPIRVFPPGLVVLLLICGVPRLYGAVVFEPVGAGALAAPSTQWRLMNLDAVTYGWTLGELRFFSDPLCTELVAGFDTKVTRKATAPPYYPIASGSRNGPPEQGFDGQTWTEWRSECYMCDEQVAWLGVVFSTPVVVQCFEVWQWGSREYLSAGVELQRWAESGSAQIPGRWEGVLRGFGLLGKEWQTVRFVKCEPLAPPDGGRVDITNNEFYPAEASFFCTGARFYIGKAKEQCLSEGQWSGQASQCVSMFQAFILVAIFIFIETIAFGIYYLCVVSHRAPPLHGKSAIPEESQHHWNSDLVRGFFSQPRMPAVLSCFCPCIRLAHTWHGSGVMKYHFGVWVTQCICVCMPCVGGFMRNAFRDRVSIYTESIVDDFAVWFFCWPCAATQEARHVDAMTELAEDERIVQEREAERRKNKEDTLTKQLKSKNEEVQQAQHSTAKLGKADPHMQGGSRKALEQIRSHSVMQLASMV